VVKKARQPVGTIIDPRTSAYAGIGLVWEVEGSKGNSYKVTLESYGYQCTCTGFMMRRDCRHLHQIDEQLGGDHDDPIYQIPKGAWNAR
jgi:hypothetical protein